MGTGYKYGHEPSINLELIIQHRTQDINHSTQVTLYHNIPFTFESCPK